MPVSIIYISITMHMRKPSLVRTHIKEELRQHSFRPKKHQQGREEAGPSYSCTETSDSVTDVASSSM
jgi:hypothetical protein